jgi:uncharacterized Tic20 family protein
MKKCGDRSKPAEKPVHSNYSLAETVFSFIGVRKHERGIHQQTGSSPSKEERTWALNFQLAVLIASLIAAATICIFIGIILLPVVVIGNIVFSIIAAVAANKGEAYRYPITIRFI